jgi:hypothetical protein
VKIIGGHDYYDGAGYGVDETIVFLRKESEHKDHPFSLPPPYGGSRHSHPTLHYILVFCGGEVFPGLRETVSYGFDREGNRVAWDKQVEDEYYYDFESALEAMTRVSKMGSRHLDEVLNRHPRETLERHFQRKATKEWTDWLIENRVITGYAHVSGRSMTDNVAIDANISTLKDLKFFKVLDPATAHMRIANFIGGVLPHGTDVVEIGNTSKIRKAGFDTKTSFRMPKGTKKPRRAKG